MKTFNYVKTQIKYIFFLLWLVYFHARYGFGIIVFHNPKRFICRSCWSKSKPDSEMYRKHFRAWYDVHRKHWRCTSCMAKIS